MKIRIGQGFDVHAFAEGRKLMLGGVEIVHPLGLLGHSDADVLVHALCDALLGAAALGDIGHLFPDTDASFKGADSLILLAEVMRQVRAGGFELGNADVTVMAEAPKLAPHIPAMRQKLAAAMQVGADQLSIKATTTEKLGFTGRGEGIAAMSVALLTKD
ncbi:MAG: 2-C-methyl-D-erythritol 2,4-cyclodiphosphate synthase [Mariprofundaceae bacterium]|nr:2-C-methyl-D-erythritol 2,4-cyclodiphosphate synthase [Mariprofundaceae bacterium]